MLRSTVVGSTLVALLTLSGCNGESADPADSMSTWTPSAPTDSPSPSESATEAPTEPELPKAATKASEAGARAFIDYYWQLLDHAQTTGDVEALQKVSGPQCLRCKANAQAVEKHYAEGGHITAGNYSTAVERWKQLTTSSGDEYIFNATVAVSHDAHVAVAGDGSQTPYAAATVTYTMAIIWADRHWRLDVLEKD